MVHPSPDVGQSRIAEWYRSTTFAPPRQILRCGRLVYKLTLERIDLKKNKVYDVSIHTIIDV